MKLRYYTHASFQAITADGTRLLTDPWAYNPINRLWQYPECPIGPETYVDQDYLYISHHHTDHLCADTLVHFRRDIPIIIRRYADGSDPVRPTLDRLGFKEIISISHRQTVTLEGALKVTLYADLNTYDSSVVIEDGVNVLYNQNDCNLSLEEARRIGANHDVDLALLGLINASIYPIFFDMPDALKASEGDRIKRKVLARASAYGEAIGAPVVMPCAADMIYFTLPETDAYIGPTIHDFAEYAEAGKLPFRVLTPSPGDTVDLSCLPQRMQARYSSHRELVSQLEALRRRPDVMATAQALARWENGFVYDRALFARHLSDYFAHVTAHFDALLAEQLPSVRADRYEARLAVLGPDGPADGHAIEIDFAGRRVSVSPCAFTRTVPAGTDMVFETEGKFLQMMIEGATTFDDVRAGCAVLRRPGDFCIEEVVFWHVMIGFSGWLESEGLVQPGTREFRERVSPVFGPATAVAAAE